MDAALIGSILRLPGLRHLTLSTEKVDCESEGEESSYTPRTCIDGKQRLLALFKFLNGETGIRSDNPENPGLVYYGQPIVNRVEKPVEGRAILPEFFRQRVKNHCYNIIEYDDHASRLFVRSQEIEDGPPSVEEA